MASVSENSSANYKLLINRLDAFIRKFYINKLIRGVLFFIAALLTIYLLFSGLEYYYFFSEFVRKILFYSFIALFGFLFIILILIPLLKYFKLGKTINYTTAAKIIGSHFHEIEDRLLNILQLSSSETESAGKELILASINQKIEKINPIPFSLAINLKKNKRYLKYALPPFLIFLFILFAAPNILRDSNYRLINNNTFFEKAAPFQFHLLNTELKTPQYEDYKVELEIQGDVLPQTVKIEYNKSSYSMIKSGAHTYSFTINKIPSDINFVFSANGFKSKEYQIQVLQRPTISGFDIKLNYPDYTRKTSEIISNAGDIIVPEGTEVSWIFKTLHTDKVEFIFPNKFSSAEKSNKDEFSFSKKVFSNEIYFITLSNENSKKNDSVQYAISTIADAYPLITVQQFVDSTDDKFLFFAGDISDDYGLSKLTFHYKIEGTDDKENLFLKKEGDDRMSINVNILKSEFNHSVNLHKYELVPGDRISYYFEIWDNDGIHGSKSSRSITQQYIIPTINELEQLKNESNEEIKDNLKNVLEEISDIQKETEDLKDKFLEKKELNWEDKKAIENLMQRQKNAQETVQDLKTEFDKNISMQKEYLQPKEEITKKQEELQKMFDEVLTDEMKKLMDDIQKLLEELNKEQSLQNMDEMKMNNEQLEQELDRMLELFKNLEMDQKLQETIDKMNELADKQQDAAEKTKEKQSDKEQNIDNQKDITKKFDEIEKDLDELREMNEDLEKKRDLESTEPQQQEINEQQQNAEKQMQQNDKKKASESQSQAGKKMKEMAEQMQQQMNQQQMQQQQEDLNSLKQLLDNLVKLSVDQESLMDELKLTKTANPNYVQLMAKQEKIREDNKIVEDSLIALSKRVFQISSTITREISGINENLNKGLEQLAERATNQANVYQQKTMTGYNNLALMLDEVMQQMQQQMSQSMPGSQMCQKPGGESQLPSLGEMQKQLNDQLQKMKGEMQNGQQKGNKEGMSKDLAEMAAKQAAIREALQKMAHELGGGNTEDGKLAKELQELADKMDKTEEDIVNKNLNEETLKRQQDILTRLLEAADSERQRKTDNERESNTAKDISKQIPPSLQEYLNKRNQEIDLLKTVSPDLKPFYKNLVEDYFNLINK